MACQFIAEPTLEEYVEQFLIENNGYEEWKHLFRQNEDLNKLIHHIVKKIDALESDKHIPKRRNIFRAFSHCSPESVKVVIIGHEPIQNPSLSTGLSFSFPRGERVDTDVGSEERSNVWTEGKSVRDVHDALCAAGILEQGGTYDSCHEEWAVRGVLLLNASLTLRYVDKMFEFITEILFQVAQPSKRSHVFYAFWGTNAEIVGELLLLKLQTNNNKQIIKYDNDKEMRTGPPDARCIIYIGHHPTFPRDCPNFYKNQATNQFKEMNTRYPGIFNLTNLKVVEAGTNSQRDREEEAEAMRKHLAEASLTENNFNE